jgi:hypothetical protein
MNHPRAHPQDHVVAGYVPIVKMRKSEAFWSIAFLGTVVMACFWPWLLIGVAVTALVLLNRYPSL